MMNYFDFFQIPVAFNIDKEELRAKFIANSKKFHPDFYTLESEEEQDRVLELSTINNKGWKELSDPQKRVAHLLIIQGAMPEEGQAKIPQEFLMEMMDINEALMELEFEEDASKKSDILQSIDSLVGEIEQEGQAAMTAWDEEQESSFLDLVRDYYLKLKYINRIKQRLK